MLTISEFEKNVFIKVQKFPIEYSICQKSMAPFLHTIKQVTHDSEFITCVNREAMQKAQLCSTRPFLSCMGILLGQL